MLFSNKFYQLSKFICLGEVPPLLPVKIAGMALDAVVSTLYPEDKHYQDMKENIARPFTPIITKSNHLLDYSMFKANVTISGLFL